MAKTIRNTTPRAICRKSLKRKNTSILDRVLVAVYVLSMAFDIGPEWRPEFYPQRTPGKKKHTLGRYIRASLYGAAGVGLFALGWAAYKEGADPQEVNVTSNENEDIALATYRMLRCPVSPSPIPQSNPLCDN